MTKEELLKNLVRLLIDYEESQGNSLTCGGYLEIRDKKKEFYEFDGEKMVSRTSLFRERECEGCEYLDEDGTCWKH